MIDACETAEPNVTDGTVSRGKSDRCVMRYVRLLVGWRMLRVMDTEIAWGEGAYTIQRDSKAGREETDAMMGDLYEMLLFLIGTKGRIPNREGNAEE